LDWGTSFGIGVPIVVSLGTLGMNYVALRGKANESLVQLLTARIDVLEKQYRECMERCEGSEAHRKQDAATIALSKKEKEELHERAARYMRLFLEAEDRIKELSRGL